MVEETEECFMGVCKKHYKKFPKEILRILSTAEVRVADVFKSVCICAIVYLHVFVSVLCVYLCSYLCMLCVYLCSYRYDCVCVSVDQRRSKQFRE